MNDYPYISNKVAIAFTIGWSLIMVLVVLEAIAIR